MRRGNREEAEALSPDDKVKIRAIEVVVLIVYLFMSCHNVEVTEYALCYSLLTRTVGTQLYTSGRHFIGPFSCFIKFPSVLTTVQFSDVKMQYDLDAFQRGESELQSRTRDGLDVRIELSFQYQLLPEKIRELYLRMGPYPDYHNIFVRFATDRLTESTTWFSANQFFIERTRIGKRMEEWLKNDFEGKLFSTIFSFQLRSVGLPPEFEDAIQQTEVMKQETKVALAEQNSTLVALETDLMIARRRTKIASNKAEGQAAAVMLANKADIAQYKATQKKSADSYDQVLKKLDDKPEDLIMYMQARVLRDHPGDKTMVGLSLPLPAKTH